MALRAAILASAIKQIPTLSFTRAALNAGLASLPQSTLSSISPSTSSPPDDAAREAIIDTVFGTDSSAPRALVEAWEEAGNYIGELNGPPKERTLTALSQRLEWSATVGEHLVEVRLDCIH